MLAIKPKSQARNTVLASIAALVMAASLVLCLVQASGTSLSVLAVTVTIAGACIGVAIFAVFRVNKKVACLILGLCVVGCILLHGLLVGGFAFLLQGFQHNVFLLNGHYRMALVAAVEQGVPVVACALAALLGLLSACANSRGVALWSILWIVAVAALAVIDWLPMGIPLVTFAVGVVLALAACAQAFVRCDTAGARLKGVALGLAVVIVLVGIGVVVGVALHPSTQTVSSAILGLFSDDDYALNQGDLKAGDDLNLSTKSALELQVAAGDADQLYVRNYVGDEYEDGVWQQLDSDTVEDFAPTALWLDQQGYSMQGQVAQAANEAKMTSCPESDMTIKNTGAREGLYLPYSLSGTDGLQLSAVPSWPVVSGDTDSYSVKVRLGLTHKAYLIQDVLSTDGTSDDFATEESAYEEFVQAQYLDVPENVRSALKKILGTSKGLTVDEAKYVATAYLDEYYTYDATPDAAPQDIDPLLWFMQQRAGYSQQYASLACMILRYYGVPARYVEGYYVKLGDRDQQTTVKVTENDAHAWVEYYLEGVGWVPFDVTPGYGDDASFYEVTENTTTTDSPQLQGVLSRLSSAVSTWKPQTLTEDESGLSDETVPTRKETSANMLLIALCGVVVLLLLLLAARVIYVRRRLKRLRTAMDAADAAGLTRGMSYVVMLCTRYFGCDFGNRPLVFCGDAVEQSGACENDVFVQAARANDHALFSGGEIEACHLDAVKTARVQVMTNLKNKRKGLKRLWDRFVMGRY